MPCGAVLYVRAVWCVNRRRQGRQGAGRAAATGQGCCEWQRRKSAKQHCAVQAAEPANEPLLRTLSKASSRRRRGAAHLRVAPVAYDSLGKQLKRRACSRMPKWGAILYSVQHARLVHTLHRPLHHAAAYCTTCSYARPHSVTVRRMYDMRVVVATALRFLTIACAFESTAVSAI